MNGYKSILKERTAGALIFRKPNLVQIDNETTIEEALQLMKERNILALPVVNKKTSQFIGVVHTFDIMLYLAYGFFKSDEPVTAESLSAKKEKVSTMPASELIGIAHYGKAGWWHDGLFVYEPTKPLLEILDVLAGGVQRVLIRLEASVDNGVPQGSGINESSLTQHRVLSQTDVVRFLLLHSTAMEEIASKSIEQLGLTQYTEYQQCVTISTNDTALTGFRHMYNANGDAVAVIDSNGKFVATLSASDLRGITLNSISDLFLPVMEFLKKRCNGSIAHPVTATKNSSLQHVMTKCSLGNIHRVWVVDAATHKPEGVIRLTDILRCVLNSE